MRILEGFAGSFVVKLLLSRTNKIAILRSTNTGILQVCMSNLKAWIKIICHHPRKSFRLMLKFECYSEQAESSYR